MGQVKVKTTVRAQGLTNSFRLSESYLGIWAFGHDPNRDTIILPATGRGLTYAVVIESGR